MRPQNCLEACLEGRFLYPAKTELIPFRALILNRIRRPAAGDLSGRAAFESRELAKRLTKEKRDINLADIADLFYWNRTGYAKMEIPAEGRVKTCHH